MHHFGIEHEAHMRQEELLRLAQERRQVRVARSSGGLLERREDPCCCTCWECRGVNESSGIALKR